MQSGVNQSLIYVFQNDECSVIRLKMSAFKAPTVFYMMSKFQLATRSRLEIFKDERAAVGNYSLVVHFHGWLKPEFFHNLTHRFSIYSVIILLYGVQISNR